MQKKKEKKADKTMGGEDATVLNDTLKAIQTKFGEGAIMKFGDSPKVDINVIPTGSIGLDMALGIGGIPRGRIIEIFGPESSGRLPFHCTSWPKRKKKVVSAHTLMLNTPWIRTIQKNSAST